MLPSGWLLPASRQTHFSKATFRSIIWRHLVPCRYILSKAPSIFFYAFFPSFCVFLLFFSILSHTLLRFILSLSHSRVDVLILLVPFFHNCFPFPYFLFCWEINKQYSRLRGVQVGRMDGCILAGKCTLSSHL